MSNVIEPIVISSGEESDEVIIIKEIPSLPEKKEMDVKSLETMSNFRLSNSKLKALKSRKRRDELHTATNNVIENRPCEPETPVIKSSPKLQIDPKKLKKLRAVVKIELGQSPLAKSLKKKKQSDDEVLPDGMLSPAKNAIDSLPESDQAMEDALRRMTLSPSKYQSPQSPKITPQKVQSTLEQWVTPTKRVRKQSPMSPSFDVNAKRNELVWPPSHVVLKTEQFIKRLYQTPRDLPTTYKYLVESLEDEQLFFLVVKTIDSCMSKEFAPSSELLWYLVENILSKSSNARLVCFTYSLLNDIIEKYPTKCIRMNITSEDIIGHFKTTELCSKLAMSFLLSVLSVELKATALKSKQRRLSKHFSADFDIQHVKYVIPHLRKCLENHTSTPNSCGIGDTPDMPEETCICGLELFQNLLKLFMIVSLNKENVAIRLADQLMYLYIDLPNLQQRVLLLQSVTSHRIRQHLIKVLLMNYCSLLPEALKDQTMPLCVKKILLQDFYRQPPKRGDESSHSPEDVEEYITLLAYLLQSYVVIHTASLHGYHNDYTLCNHDNVREFSQEDLWYLKDLKSHVSSLRGRCVSFLGNENNLSFRTNILFYTLTEVIV